MTVYVFCYCTVFVLSCIVRQMAEERCVVLFLWFERVILVIVSSRCPNTLHSRWHTQSSKPQSIILINLTHPLTSILHKIRQHLNIFHSNPPIFFYFQTTHNNFLYLTTQIISHLILFYRCFQMFSQLLL